MLHPRETECEGMRGQDVSLAGTRRFESRPESAAWTSSKSRSTSRFAQKSSTGVPPLVENAAHRALDVVRVRSTEVPHHLMTRGTEVVTPALR